MAAEIFTLLAYSIANPFEDARILHVIVIDPSLISGVIRRVDIDTINAPLILRKQRLQSDKIVAVYYLVATFGSRLFPTLRIKTILMLQNMKRHL